MPLALPPSSTENGTPPYTYSTLSGKKVADDLRFSYEDRTEHNEYAYDLTGRVTSSTSAPARP